MKTNRRNFFQTLGVSAAGIGIATTLPLTSCTSATTENKDENDDQVLFVGDNIAVTDTVYG